MKNYLIPVLLVAALVLGAIGAFKSAPAPVISHVGGGVGPDFFWPFESHNGVSTYFYQQKLTPGTTTPCSFKTPAATSTLMSSIFRIASSSAVADYVEFGKAATPYATTTSLGIYTLAANAQGVLLGSTSQSIASAIADNSAVFAPSQYVVVKVNNTQLGGQCTAVFQTI